MTREHIKTSMTKLENITKETCNDAQSQTPKTMQNATKPKCRTVLAREEKQTQEMTPSKSSMSTNVEWEAPGHLKHRLDINAFP
jgi:hypothetical protein